MFAVDYAIRLRLAEDRWRFVRGHPLDLAAVALAVRCSPPAASCAPSGLEDQGDQRGPGQGGEERGGAPLPSVET
jgi:hypothetical protein